jgi:signal transduction histidine kinase
MGVPLRLLVRDDEERGPSEVVGESPAIRTERDELLEQIHHLQGLAQAGLVTAGLAHDVKNHVTVISGTAFLAEQNDDPEAWRAALRTVQEQCVALTETTRAFLNFVERREAAASAAFPLSRVPDHVQRLLRAYAGRRDVTLESEVKADGRVKGEFRLALQAAVNVVTNAIRACKERRGRVKMTVSRPLPATCRLSIEDDGPGIPEELRPTLFRPFSTSRKGNGHGLGLFVTRQLVRELGGSIQVRTSPAGTTFFLDFPTD